MSHDRSGFSLVVDFLDRFLHGGDRERVGLLLVIGTVLCSIGACFLFSSLYRGHSLAGALNSADGFDSPESLQCCSPVLLLCSGLLMLLGAAAISLKQRIQADPDRRETTQRLSALPSDCTVCGSLNPPDSEYCGECGAALESAEA